MARSFDLVDRKLAEADFFLKHLMACDGDIFSASCYFSAFVAAARSVTFSLQSVSSKYEGFNDWYEQHQSRLKSDEYAKFFHQARTLGQHVGVCPLRSGSLKMNSSGQHVLAYFFRSCPDFPMVPDSDVVTACGHYMKRLAEIVFDAYQVFGRFIDPEQYYSAEAFQERGLSIEDAEEEVFGIRGWTGGCNIPIDYRWQMLRDSVPKSEIDHLLNEYLGRVRCVPKRIERPKVVESAMPDGWTRKDGWTLPPGFDDISSYLQSLRRDDG